MYTSGYNRLFRGFLLAMLDFRIQTFDLLPDFIGFIMMYIALGDLAGQHRFFGKAKPYALTLIFISLPELIQLPGTDLLKDHFTTSNILVLIWSQLYTVINLFLIFWICRAIYEIADTLDNSQLALSSKTRWHYCFTTSSIILIFTPFTINLEDSWRAALIPLVIISFITVFLIALLIPKAGRDLSDNLTSPQKPL